MKWSVVRSRASAWRLRVPGSHTIASGVLVLCVTMLFVFQNCGQNGGGGGGGMTGPDPATQAYMNSPFPYDFNFNQISYMTCPMVDTQNGSPQEAVDSPFYTIRGGSFDNRSMATRYPGIFTGVFQDPERTYRLKAGVGLSGKYLAYMKSTFSARLGADTSTNALAKLLRDGLINGDFDVTPLSGLIFRLRTAQGFAWNPNAANFGLFSLVDANTANQLVEGMDLGQYGMERQNYLTGEGALSQRSLVVNINEAASESERDFLMQQMGTNLQVQAGFGTAGSAAAVLSLMSPGDNNKTLFGRTYRFTTGNQWPGRIDYDGAGQPHAATSITDDFVTAVDEVDTSNTYEIDLSQQEGQNWNCFSLLIVRDNDRRDSLSGRFFDPDNDPTLQVNGAKQKYYDYQAAPTAPIIPGVRVACPPQELGDGTKPGTLNYMGDGGVARLQLEVARRFLPASLWEINTDAEYMCAVPRIQAKSFGQCYTSGDFDATQYIMYTQQGVELGQSVRCGINPVNGQTQIECPAFVSFCYKTQ